MKGSFRSRVLASLAEGPVARSGFASGMRGKATVDLIAEGLVDVGPGQALGPLKTSYGFYPPHFANIYFLTPSGLAALAAEAS